MPSRTENLARTRFRIGAIDVHPDRYVVIRDGEEIDLAPRTMDLLVELAEGNGKAVSRAHLLEKVWKNTDLDDNPVNKSMSELREKLGDDASAPTYIKTIRGGGYRIVAPIVFPKGYRRRQKQRPIWSGGNPYVGLAAFDESHADVFFGRDRMEETLLQAMRSQLDNGRRLVLLHGASGSGKTSLLQARIIPTLTKQRESDDLHALAVAHCDLASAQPGDSIGALASALASWTLDRRPVFPPQPIEDLKKLLIETPEAIEGILDEAFRKFPDRKAAEQPLSHLLLVIDHTEKLVDSSAYDLTSYERFSRAMTALCDSEHTLTAMIVRGDFYLKLLEALPDLMERKGSDGHIDVLRPLRGEIAEIIRSPAECARLEFEQDPETDDYLDDKLIEDAQGKPDVLPLLQHTLEQLYERRDKSTGMLTFAAYNSMEGLEGTIAHRAEEVFASLPPEAQASLDDVLSQLFVIQLDSDAVKRSGLFLDTLDERARTLVQAFTNARLFVSEQGDNRPRFSVTHEALLRRWPRAAAWSKNNQRLLKARGELKIAAERWKNNGCQKDHLLNPGRPLIEALEVSIVKNMSLTADELNFLIHSNRQHMFNIRLRRAAISSLFILSFSAVILSIYAMKSQAEAVMQRDIAKRSNAFVIGEIADRLDPTADMGLIEKISTTALESCRNIETIDASLDELVNCSRAHRKIGKIRILQSNFQEALRDIDQSVDLSRRAISIAPKSKSALNEAGQSMAWLGKLRQSMGDMHGAMSAWEEYLKFSDALVSIYPEDPESHIQKSYALTNLGSSEIDLGHYKKALFLLSESESIKKIVLAKQKKPIAEQEFEMAVTASFICNIYAKTDHLSGASACYMKQIGIIRKLIDKNSAAKDWKRQLANLMQLYASVELDRGNSERAQEIVEDSIQTLTILNKEEPENHSWATHLAKAHRLASDIARIQRKPYQCTEHLDIAIKIMSDYQSPSTTWKATYSTLLPKKSNCGLR